MRAAWWISTPHYTCLVVVDAAGRIVDTAPRLWQTWRRRSWASCDWEHQRRWGTQYRRVRLEES